MNLNALTAALVIAEIYDFGTPAQKSRATSMINGFINGDIRDWSWEERDPGLYASLLSKAQMGQIIERTGYVRIEDVE